jgi:hypothetical protein
MAPLLNPARVPQEYEARQRQLVGQVFGTDAREEYLGIARHRQTKNCPDTDAGVYAKVYADYTMSL